MLIYLFLKGGETNALEFFRHRVEFEKEAFLEGAVSMGNSFWLYAQQSTLVAVFCIFRLSSEFDLLEFHRFCVDTGHSERFIEDEKLSCVSH